MSSRYDVIGILRLWFCFASRSKILAHDDSAQGDKLKL